MVAVIHFTSKDTFKVRVSATMRLDFFCVSLLVINPARLVDRLKFYP